MVTTPDSMYGFSSGGFFGFTVMFVIPVHLNGFLTHTYKADISVVAHSPIQRYGSESG